MASRKAAKQNEKNEKSLRSLAKQPGNRVCMNCPQKGPHLYICTTFNTFVCSDCSGIHRDFSHRVKSISLSTFTQDEVTNLEASGGNESARELWLASYNGGDNLKAGETAKIKEFMKLCYVDTPGKVSLSRRKRLLQKPQQK